MTFHVSRTDARFLGIDACPGGWACVARHVDDSLAVDFSEALEPLLDRHPACTIGIDIPIGLPDGTTGIEPGIRQCDKQARKLLGFPRSTSIFSAPVRPLLDIDDKDIVKSHQEASAMTMAISNRKVTRQTMNILPRIREVDGLLQQSSGLSARMSEVHPELVFMEMNGKPIAESKRSAEGRARRLKCLHDVFGSDAVESCIEMIDGTPIKLDDLMDASACCWSAGRIGRGTHHALPSNPELDSTGLPMTISY